MGEDRPRRPAQGPRGVTAPEVEPAPAPAPTSAPSPEHSSACARGPRGDNVTGRRLYGRGAGRPLSPRQQGLVDDFLPSIAVPQTGPIAPAALFESPRAARLEIGFGAGDHLAAQAARRPDTGFIGAEFFLEGVGKALARIAAADLENVRLHVGDGRDLLERIAAASLEAVYVLFPDPWPKTRHHKRRFIQTDTVAELARILAPGGVLRVATDVKSYVDWALFHVRANQCFTWTARAPSDWRDPPADHVTTRYETKNLGDCPPVFLDFSRR